jgi:hypothetical protein
MARDPAVTGTEHYFSRLKRENPERLKEFGRGDHGGRPKGTPFGMSKRRWAVTLDEAHKLARKIMKKAEENGDLPENALARDAMKQAIVMLASDELIPKDKLAVIRTILEYNMAKPAATSNVNIKTAEDFLDELAEE